MLKWFRALMPREDRFFELFARHSETLVAGAVAMRGLLDGGDALQKHYEEIVRQEQKADDITREVLQAIRRTFVTPFDRGDIKDLIQSMDDAIDQMNRTAKSIMLFELREFTPLMREMGDTIVESARLTAEAVPLLSAVGTHSSRLSMITEKITRVEGRSDDLHDQGLKELYLSCKGRDAMEWIVGSEVYANLEDVVDRFEDVANEISGIVVENV